MKPILMLTLFVAALQATAQTHTEKINKDYSFAKPGTHTVMIANINGGIQVEGYDGDKVLLEVTKTVTGKTTERLEKGKTEVQLGVEDLADTLIFFVNSGCCQLRLQSQRKERKAKLALRQRRLLQRPLPRRIFVQGRLRDPCTRRRERERKHY